MPKTETGLSLAQQAHLECLGWDRLDRHASELPHGRYDPANVLETLMQ